MLNILVGGSSDGKGWFFPDGVNGRIKTPRPLNPDVSRGPLPTITKKSTTEEPRCPDTYSGALRLLSG